MAGFDILRPPIGETIFNKEGVINEVWNKFFTEIVGIEQFRYLEGIVANHVLIGYDIASTDYVAHTSGWRIASDSGTGVAEFNIPIVSYANISGSKPPTDADHTATIIGSAVITTGTLSVVQGGTSTAGITGNTSGDTAVRFWAGGAFADRATAPFRVLQNGAVYMTGAIIDSISTLNGVVASTVVTNAANGATFTSSSTITNAQAANVTTILGDKITTTYIGSPSGIKLDMQANVLKLIGGTNTVGNSIRLGPNDTDGYVSGYDGDVTLTAGSDSTKSVALAAQSSGGFIDISAATTVTIAGSTGGIVAYASGVKPASTNTAYKYNGTSALRWYVTYSDIYYATSGQYYDTIDDLEVIHNIKPDKNGKVDLTTLPRNFTSFDEVKIKLKKENGDLLTDTEIEEVLLDHDDMAHLLCINIPEFLNLIEGSVRQLDKETSGLIQQISEWINNVDNRVKNLEKEKI